MPLRGRCMGREGGWRGGCRGRVPVGPTMSLQWETVVPEAPPR